MKVLRHPQTLSGQRCQSCRPAGSSFVALGIAVLAAGALAAAAPPSARAQAACPWIGSPASADARAHEVLARMSLDEKISMLGLAADPEGYENFVPAIPRLCIPKLTLQDGPAGVASGFRGVTQLPAPIAVAASFDRSVAARYGAIQGTESWGKGIDAAQGPDVNMARVPQNGRTFEGYGEDPFLASRIAVADIRGIQRAGVMAMVKHFAVNSHETNRQTNNAVLDERTLRELYLPAFEAAVDHGRAAAAMCAFNKVNGVYACQNSTLLDILKAEYEFGGFVRSDRGAVRNVAASYRAGMDMMRPEANAALLAAVQAGDVPVSRIDDAVLRVLREMFRFDLFDRARGGAPDTVVTSAEHASAARRFAEAGTVLLKNSNGALPLTSSARSIAVIGPDGGDGAYTAGAGSSHVVAPYVVTPYQAIKDRAGTDVQVTYTEGLRAGGALPPVAPSALTPPSGVGQGLRGQYYNNQSETGAPVLTRTDANVDFVWGVGQNAVSPGPGVNATNWSAKWDGTLTAPATGKYGFSLTSDDGSTLFIDGRKVVDNGGNHSVQTRTGTIDLNAGPHQILVHYFNNTADDQVHLGWLPPGGDPYGGAAQAARDADVAIVFANDVESEGTDRGDLSLPFDQNGLIRTVAAANAHTVVVLHTGSAVTMPWLEDVKAVVEGWYAGQEDGNAIASVLFGGVNPSGKLPLTFPRSEADTPAHAMERWPGVNGNAEYTEGLQMGYRWYDAQGIAPLFPFGHGLSYTSFRVDGVTTGPARLGAALPEVVSAQVTNTGERAGSEVVQLYASLPASTGEPPKRLVGFRKVALGPGETRTIRFRLKPRDLSYWDVGVHGWVMAAGDYSLMVGTSSRDIAHTATLSVTRPIGPRYVNLSAPTIVDPGSVVDVRASFTNDTARAVSLAQLGLRTPDGWTAAATSASSFRRVPPGETVTTTWRLAVPPDARPNDYRLTATASYLARQRKQRSSSAATLYVPYPSLEAAYNNVGVTDDADHAPGDFDGSGNSYSAQALAAKGITPGSPVPARHGITFTWPPAAAGTKDNVAMDGQVVAMAGSGGTLGFLGAATSLTLTATGTVFYTDGSAQPFTLTFPDWFSTAPDDDRIALLDRLNRTNDKPQHAVSLFAGYVSLAPGKTVRAVQLPRAGWVLMHAFAMAIA